MKLLDSDWKAIIVEGEEGILAVINTDELNTYGPYKIRLVPNEDTVHQKDDLRLLDKHWDKAVIEKVGEHKNEVIAILNENGSAAAKGYETHFIPKYRIDDLIYK